MFYQYSSHKEVLVGLMGDLSDDQKEKVSVAIAKFRKRIERDIAKLQQMAPQMLQASEAALANMKKHRERMIGTLGRKKYAHRIRRQRWAIRTWKACLDRNGACDFMELQMLHLFHGTLGLVDALQNVSKKQRVNGMALIMIAEDQAYQRIAKVREG